MKMNALTEVEIQERLAGLENWKFESNRLVRSQAFPSYLDALEFVYKTGQAAEAHNHHPDIFMFYKRVEIRYWTHKANGITGLDFDMARQVESILKETYRGKTG